VGEEVGPEGSSSYRPCGPIRSTQVCQPSLTVSSGNLCNFSFPMDRPMGSLVTWHLWCRFTGQYSRWHSSF
jgi:hypothetical protein